MHPTTMPALFLVLLAALCGAGPSAAQAPPPPAVVTPQPDRTTASYGDWVLRCDLAATGERSCEVAQTIQDARGQLLAHITARRAPAGGQMLLTVQVGTNIAIPEPVRLMIDEQAALNLAFRRCLPRGCFAELQLPDSDAVSFAQRAEAARFDYRGADGASLSIPVSLRGLAPSLEALKVADRA
jgi:invasion protein IalB